jgi:hypothetical protein
VYYRVECVGSRVQGSGCGVYSLEIMLYGVWFML